MAVAYQLMFHLALVGLHGFPDSVLLYPSIQFSFPCLAKFFPALGPKQFLYLLMVITT